MTVIRPPAHLTAFGRWIWWRLPHVHRSPRSSWRNGWEWFVRIAVPLRPSIFYFGIEQYSSRLSHFDFKCSEVRCTARMGCWSLTWCVKTALARREENE